jgi:hypothetical protein
MGLLAELSSDFPLFSQAKCFAIHHWTADEPVFACLKDSRTNFSSAPPAERIPGADFLKDCRGFTTGEIFR